jgi:hypothetical protein
VKVATVSRCAVPGRWVSRETRRAPGRFSRLLAGCGPDPSGGPRSTDAAEPSAALPVLRCTSSENRPMGTGGSVGGRVAVRRPPGQPRFWSRLHDVLPQREQPPRRSTPGLLARSKLAVPGCLSHVEDSLTAGALRSLRSLRSFALDAARAAGLPAFLARCAAGRQVSCGGCIEVCSGGRGPPSQSQESAL